MFLFETPEGLFSLAFGVIFMVMAISWIAFARLTMARIERQMCEDGLQRPAQWDGIGYRVIWYAYAIAVPVTILNSPNNPFFDGLTVKSYATHYDRIVGLVFLISGAICSILGLLGAFVFKFY